MGKKYVTVPDEMRQEIIRLINEDGKTITEASQATGVFYPTVKAIQKVYATTGRINKIKHWKQKVKRKRGKQMDPEDVYEDSSSSEPASSDIFLHFLDICNDDASLDPSSKSGDNNSPQDPASLSVSIENVREQRLSNSSVNRSAISSIKLVSVSDEAVGKDKASLVQENSSPLIRKISIPRDKDLVGT